MIMRRRAVARSAVRLAAGTAVVAGTAGAIRHHQDQKYAAQDAQQQAQYDDSQQQAQMEQLEQQNAMQQQQIQQMQAQQAAAQQAAPAPAAPAAGGTDLNSQLMQLSQMHNAGVLTDEEFAQAKAKLLAGG
ncbi:MAG: SHOCT domain-containing protein [Chloroflexota bacterium]|nr:MAG: SHOCT domain-containing protein [Chloroflexota bacterium]